MKLRSSLARKAQFTRFSYPTVELGTDDIPLPQALPAPWPGHIDR